ncbi:MAG: entericidin A/B family lipoprotein [Erythrobacter sp.]|jgi:entericidin B|nr:entericidin A/B family lipoprotein [Erythrobacter sp.]
MAHTPFSRRTLAILAASSLAAMASACNTVQGAGEDIESVGEAGEDVIDG